MTWEPADALRRIAFLLERSRAGTYRVKAFRGAAATVPATDPQELRARADAGTLRRPARHRQGDRGRGPRGAGRRDAPPTSPPWRSRPPGRSPRAARRCGRPLRGDLHSPLRLVRRRLADRGDGVHRDRARPRLPRADRPLAPADGRQRALRRAADQAARRRRRGQRAPRRRRLPAAQGASRSTSSTTAGSTRPTRCSTGSTCGSPPCTPSSKMDAAAMTRRMVGAVRNPRTNVLGHCTGRLVDGRPRHPRPERSSTPQAVFAACAEHDVAVEINSRPERRDPPDELIALACDAGCLFSIDSDAHAPGQLDFQIYGCARAERAGIAPDRIVNTWDARPPAGVGPSRLTATPPPSCRPPGRSGLLAAGESPPCEHETGPRQARGRAHFGDWACLSPMLPVSSTDPSCCSLGGEGPPSDIGSRSPSSSGLGPRPFTAVARVRIPLGIRSTRPSPQGPVAQLVSAPPCHGGGRRFEPGRGRSKMTERPPSGAAVSAFPGRARRPRPSPCGRPS